MAKINLLPWREARRKEQQQEFFVMLGVGLAVAGIIVYSIVWYHNQLIDAQKARNGYLEDQIVLLDKKIEEIRQLESEKEKLLARMRAIEQLQGNRPLIVRFFDELVRSLPEGVSVTSITQKETTVSIDGEAQSNARVSSFMRKLEESEWLEKPELEIIQVKNDEDVRISSFKMRFSQVIPKSEEDEES